MSTRHEPPAWMLPESKNPFVDAYRKLGQRDGFTPKLIEDLAQDLARYSNEMFEIARKGLIRGEMAGVHVEMPPDLKARIADAELARAKEEGRKQGRAEVVHEVVQFIGYAKDHEYWGQSAFDFIDDSIRDLAKKERGNA